MSGPANLNRRKYRELYEESYKELLCEIKNLNIGFENDQVKGLKIKCLNDCNDTSESIEKLFDIQKETLKLVKANLLYLSTEEQLTFLKFTKFKFFIIEKITHKIILP